ncbi:MAG: hypothetical protein DRG11_05220 [Epsilonproteobacteria bacterium]|nr:MAG: hypothetical protein DRG11_05220 [Campylobacterota bacterium]
MSKTSRGDFCFSKKVSVKTSRGDFCFSKKVSVKTSRGDFCFSKKVSVKKLNSFYAIDGCGDGLFENKSIQSIKSNKYE